MTDVAVFLLERIAEDEAEVRRWQSAMQQDEILAKGVPSWVILAGGLKIPERVLNDCHAKRRIVELYQRFAYASTKDYEGGHRAASFNAVCRLAAVYNDHPDWRDEWQQ